MNEHLGPHTLRSPRRAPARRAADRRRRRPDAAPATNDRSARRASGPEIGRLVAAAAAGSQPAWTNLVGEFSGTIRAVARSHRLDESDAADVAQVTWMRLVEHLDGLHDPTRVGAWLTTAARRECLKVLRAKQRHPVAGDDVPEPVSPDPAPEHRLLARERDTALRLSFSRLQARDQELLRLLMAEPSPAYEEISLALDMPIGSIGPTRQRALRRLRQELEADESLALMSA